MPESSIKIVSLHVRVQVLAGAGERNGSTHGGGILARRIVCPQRGLAPAHDVGHRPRQRRRSRWFDANLASGLCRVKKLGAVGWDDLPSVNAVQHRAHLDFLASDDSVLVVP